MKFRCCRPEREWKEKRQRLRERRCSSFFYRWRSFTPGDILLVDVGAAVVPLTLCRLMSPLFMWQRQLLLLLSKMSGFTVTALVGLHRTIPPPPSSVVAAWRRCGVWWLCDDNVAVVVLFLAGPVVDDAVDVGDNNNDVIIVLNCPAMPLKYDHVII